MALHPSALLEPLGLTASFSILIATWIAWKFWVFTARPFLYPSEVSVLPYHIPCKFIGHAVSMFKDTVGLYRYAEAYFGYSREPYSLCVAGQQLIVVTNPKHQEEIFKNNDHYSFDPFINVVYHNVGKVSTADLNILWRKSSEGFVSLYPNPKQKVLVHTGLDLLHKQVLSPIPFQELVLKVGGLLEQYSRWESFTKSAVIHHAADSITKVVSLHRWCRDITIGAQTDSFFGPLFAELQPDYTESYDQWDINSWMATYQYPNFMAKAAYEPRERLIKTLVAYLDAPKEKRTGCVAYVNEVADEMRHAGLGTEACARVLMIILWGVNSNVQMTSFWSMVHIVSDASLLSAIRNEISPLMSLAERENDLESLRLGLMRSCPLLNSLFNEIIRFYNTGSSMRETVCATRIANKTIPKGTRIFLPQRHLLLDPEAFGEDAHTVNPYRFVQNKSLEKHGYYRPFGHGITQCTGKMIGRFEVLCFVAWAVWRYEFVVLSGTSKATKSKQGIQIPRIDLKKPSLGMSKQVEGDDLVLQIWKRIGV
ncbi:cytochrome P450 [Xylaria bambusicola]|uniref:cytochrome P450 n=1 Tax=Xylaria bambusicola TaxID=326684 RepID=UPI00200825B7|nr:cytochrome P450 [Xylaria bambusicola]KAI0513197.1 cytochrome P450 [Xylaria bambusicola]